MNLGWIFLSFVLIILIGGPPHDGWAGLWPVPLLFAFLILVVFLGGQGEVRSGPGWIAARRGTGWRVVKFDATASVELKKDSFYGYVLRFGSGRWRQSATSWFFSPCVDFTARMVRRPGIAAAAAAVVDDAASKGAAVDPEVALVFESLGLPGRGAAGVPPGIRARVEREVGDLHRPHRLRRWMAPALTVVLCLQIGAIALVVLVRLLGFH